MTRVDQKLRRLMNLPRPGGNFISLTSLARLFDVRPASARVVAKRYERKGVLRRVGPGLYANLLAAPTREELASLLWPPSYISFEFALRRSGVSTQVPQEIACVTLSRPRTVQTPWGPIRYHKLRREQFFGFHKEALDNGAHAWIADPEKALLDRIYLDFLTGLDTAIDELDRSRLNGKRLRAYLKRFPPRVTGLMADKVKALGEIG